MRTQEVGAVDDLKHVIIVVMTTITVPPHGTYNKWYNKWCPQ